VDLFDNLLLLREEPGFVLFEPVPLAPRSRPPAVPDRADWTRDDALVYLSDIYVGDGLRDVPRGEVKSLRIFTYHYLYPGMGGPQAVVGMEGPWDIKRVLGSVPVEPDGSALFRVPANTPVAVQPLENGHYLGAAPAVEITRRFVGQQDRGIRDQRPGDGDALLLASRQLIWAVVDSVRQPDHLQGVFCQLFGILGIIVAVDQRQEHVLQSARPLQQVKLLEHETDLVISRVGQFVVVQVNHVHLVQPIVSRRRLVEAAEDIHQGRFARSRSAHDGDILTGVDPERDALEHGRRHVAAVVCLFDVFHFNHANSSLG
jgi:hypothetical protein